MIKLFLVQHGDAVPDEVDTTRPLSERGAAQAKRAGEFLKKLPVYPELILHSGKKRAEQTAEIISYALGGVKMEKRPFLNPKDGIEGILEEIARFKVSVMIVGHMPFLGRLASKLVCGDESKALIDIHNASPLILVRTEEGYLLDSYLKNEYIK